MIKTVFKILIALYLSALCSTALAGVDTPVSPQLLEEPLRVFTLDADLSPESGKMLESGQDCPYAAGRWLCAEVPTNQAVLFIPAAVATERYIRLQLEASGSGSIAAEPLYSSVSADLFVQLPGEAAIICRFMPNTRNEKISIGVLGRRQAEYAWEKYEDSLKEWAEKAALEPQRPPDPPSVVPSSMADRLWFLAVWLKHAARWLQSDDTEVIAHALFESALWEVLRIRPLDGWAYGLKDRSSHVGSDCLQIEEVPGQPVNYCRKVGAGSILLEGPAVLLTKYRPEIRLEPTPVLEDGLLQVSRDGRLLYSDNVPLYPDYNEFDPAGWSIKAEPRRSPDGAVLGRAGSLKILLPPGRHEIDFQLQDKAVWWSLTYARHLSHIEDACEERFENDVYKTENAAFSKLLAAEMYNRLGRCTEAELIWNELEAKFGPDAETRFIIDFRLASCRAEGEILTPADLVYALAKLGIEADEGNMHWEDRRDELFRAEQLEDAMLEYSYSSPGYKLETAVSGGQASSAQKIALSALWHLDGVWEEMSSPSYMFDPGYSVFQDRRAYPEMDALPGGVSLLRVGSAPMWTHSRMVKGVARSTIIVSSGETYPASSIIRADSKTLTLYDAARLEKHELLSSEEMEIAKTGGVRDIWLQQRMLAEDQIADAKLVRVFPYRDGKALYFELPPESYSGYVVLQVFPPAELKKPAHIQAIVADAGAERTIDFSFSPSLIKPLPVVEDARLDLGWPLSAQFRIDEARGALSVYLKGELAGQCFIRMLLRMPRQPEEETQNSLQAVNPAVDQAVLAENMAAIADLSRRINSGTDGDEISYYRYERAVKLCALGKAGAAREDLLASGGSAGRDAVLREALLDLRRRIESGQCSEATSLDPDTLPLAVSVGIENTQGINAELSELRRQFLALAQGGDQTVSQRFELCSRMSSIDAYQAACMPWYMENVVFNVQNGRRLPPSFFEMLVRFSAWQEKVKWPGAEKVLGTLWELTHWESIASVDNMDGMENVLLESPDQLQEPPAGYSTLVSAMTSEDHSVEAWRLFEGQSLMLHLPLAASGKIGIEFKCVVLNPSVAANGKPCTMSVNIDGLAVGEYQAALTTSLETLAFNLSSGEHMLEIRHDVEHSVMAQVLVVRVFSDSALPGIPTQSAGGRHYLAEEPAYTFMRSSKAYPLAFHILGPTVLRVDSWLRTGELSNIIMEISDDNGEPLAPLFDTQKGRSDVWLTESREYVVRVKPADDDYVLLKLYFREENGELKKDLKKLRKALAVKPLAASAHKAERNETAWLDDDVPVNPARSAIGTGSLLAGYRRLLRDETGYVEPIDQYMLARAGYARRIENADLWLGVSAEGRLRFSANDSLAFDGRLYWITPGPQIHFDLQDRFALQDVSTGVAGGNMLELTVKRPFEILPHWDVTPLLSAWYKWQGINDWREDQIQPYTDADVYSPYHRDHPYAASLGVGTFYTPFVNNSFFARALAQSNSDFAGIDNVQVRIGDLMAFGRFQGTIFYDIRPRMADADRERFSLRHQLHAGAQYSWWPHSYVRISPTATYDFYPHAMQHAFFGGLLLELSPERGLRDSPPGEESFPWQVDPERYWVREW